jgi:predicted ATPase/DNA-binding CsgD family transcriptional regulator
MRGGPHDTREIVTALTAGQRNNLPAEVTRFIGRRRELPAIAGAVERHRLVTLRGAGGLGKTRLALRAAAGLRDNFADGCWLVPLSPLRAPELLARTVSETLGLPDEAAGDAPQVLAQNLAERELLLLFDTCEHLAGTCAELAALLLSAAPGLRILATSRAPLGLPDEHTLLITPLELPAADDATAAHADAVTLFVDRARAVVPDFALTPQNTPAVAELCRRLDGIPLALELAAVRLRGMRVEELLTRLSDRFRVLGTARTSTDRHRTLRAAVSWSYELCTPAEQKLWTELSVFPGGFGLAAAEYVCGPGTGETLRRLAEKSVVQFSPGGTTSDDRYQLPDTMREFGAELLHAAGAAAAVRVRARHRDYYLRLAEQAAAGSMTAGQTAWLNRLRTETANLRVALDFSFTAQSSTSGASSTPQASSTPRAASAPSASPAAQASSTARGEVPASLRLTRALLPYWLMTGQFTEGRRWHDRAVSLAPESASQSVRRQAREAESASQSVRGQAREAESASQSVRGQAQEAESATQSVRGQAREAESASQSVRGQAREAESASQSVRGQAREALSRGNAWAVFGAGVLAVQQGDFAAGGPLLTRAAELAEATGDEDLAAHVADARGMLAFYSGDLPTAQAEFEAALAVSERAGFTDPTALVTYSRLASVCLLTLERDRAVKLCEECLRRCDELGEQWARGTALWTRGAARRLSGDNVAAIEDALACLRIKEDLGDLHTIAMSFDLLSACLVAAHDYERTAVLHGASERLWTLLNAPALRGPAYAETRKSAADTARNSLGEERFDALMGHGYTVSLPVALAVAKGEAPAAPPGDPVVPGTGTRALTRRETEIAGLVADGLGNREIAERLYLSKRTVDSHVEHIFSKLGFSSRAQLTAWVAERKTNT